MGSRRVDEEPASYARNDSLVDVWSPTHVAWGVVLTVLIGPWWALLVLTLWEPIEIFVLSPALARLGVRFGREAFVNSVSDLAFNAIGAAIGWYLLLPLWDPMGIL